MKLVAISLLAGALALSGCSNKSITESETRPINTTATTKQVVQPAHSPKGTKIHPALPNKRIPITSETVWVKGTTYDSNGEPLPGTTVTLWTKSPENVSVLPWQAVASSVSNANGHFELQGQGLGKAAITARKVGYAIAAQDDLKAHKDQLGGMANTVELSLDAESVISGQLISASDLPSSGVQITAAPSSLCGAAYGELITKTDQDGYFRVTNLGMGSTPLLALLPHGGIHTITAVAPAEGVEFKLKPSTQLDGAIVSPQGAPVTTSATLWLRGNIENLVFETSATARQDGKFNFGPVTPVISYLFLDTTPPGQFQICDPSGTKRESSINLDLRDGHSTTVKVVVTSGRSISGFMQDVVTSAPVPGVEVWTEDARKESLNKTVSDNNGHFTLSNVVKLWNLKIKSDDYYRDSPEPEELAKSTDSETITLLLKRKPYLRGTVITTSGGPVPGARLSLYNLSPVSPAPEYIPLNSNGGFQIPVAAGAVRLFAEAPGMAPVFKDLIVAGEDINDLNLVCTRGRSVSGVVLSPEGQPLKGAVVLSQLCKIGGIGFEPYYPNGNTTFQLPFGRYITDASGHFQFNQAPADAGIAIKAKTPKFADTQPYYTSPDEGDVLDAKLQFPVTMALRGRVVNENGDAISGANCLLILPGRYDHQPLTATTGTTGTFTFNKVAYTTDSLNLLVLSDQYESSHQSIKLSDQMVSVTLRSLSTIALHVRCVDLHTGEPVDCKLDVSADNKPTVTPEKDKPGQYNITNLNNTKFCYLSASAEHYCTQFQEVTLDRETKLKDIEIRLKKTGKVTGRIINSQGRPMPGTIMTNSGRKEEIAHADESGSFEFEVSSSRFYIAESTEGLRSEKFYALVAADGTYDVGDVIVASDNGLNVRVMRRKQPVNDVNVKVLLSGGKSISGITGKDGVCHFAGTSYDPQFIELPDFDITKVITKVFTDQPTREITITLGDSKITGQLLTNGAPALGSVTAFRESASESLKTATDKEGYFHFEGISGGEWQVNGRLLDSYLKSKTVKVNVDDNSTINCVLNIVDGKIEGTVVDESKVPVAGARVAYSGINQSGNDVSDAEGKFVINNSAGGTVSITATKENMGNSDPVEVNFENPSPAPVVLVIKQYSGTILCSVFSILDGLPIENATARLKSADGKFTASSNSHNYSDIIIDNIPPGNYQLSIEAQGYAGGRRQVEIAEGQTLTLSEVLSPGGSVTVFAVDDKGTPVPGVTVSLVPTDANSVQNVLSDTTGETGAAKFPSVLTGTYRLSATGPQGSVNMTIPVQGDGLTVQAKLKK